MMCVIISSIAHVIGRSQNCSTDLYRKNFLQFIENRGFSKVCLSNFSAKRATGLFPVDLFRIRFSISQALFSIWIASSAFLLSDHSPPPPIAINLSSPSRSPHSRARPSVLLSRPSVGTLNRPAQDPDRRLWCGPGWNWFAPCRKKGLSRWSSAAWACSSTPSVP